MLKKTSILVIGLVLASSINAQNLSKEEKAIKKVIENETHYWQQRDFEKYADTWVHEPYIYRSYTAPRQNSELRGWNAISQWAKSAFENSSGPVIGEYNKIDYCFVVSGTMAFVTFMENGNSSTRVLEKRGSEWKLVGLSVIRSQAYKALEQEARLKKFVGNWKASPSSIKETPGFPGEELVAVDISITYTEGSLKRLITTHYRTANDAFAVRVETTIVYDANAQKSIALNVENAPWGTTAATGECEVDGDGNVSIKFYEIEDRSVLRAEEAITWKDENTMRNKVTFYTKAGKRLNTMSFDMIRQPGL
jgi:hypothetical protein